MTKSNTFRSRIIPFVKKMWDKVLYLVLLALFFLIYPGQSVYVMSKVGVGKSSRPMPFAVPTPAPYPVNTSDYYPGEEITAGGIVVLDVDSGVVLFKRNENVQLAPASTTKILTALVALDAYELDDILTVQSIINAGQVMGLVPGERITAENLLYGALIQSGNDAAYALAENYQGGVDAFVAAMNKKAKEYNLHGSSFANPVGYDDPNQKMTPMDLAQLARIALTNKVIAKMVAIPQITISDVSHTYFHPLTNVNQLLGKIPGVGGIKTGWTEEAGENLVTLVERNGHKVIIVVLRSIDRFSDTSYLIDWVYGNYLWEIPNPPKS